MQLKLRGLAVSECKQLCSTLFLILLGEVFMNTKVTIKSATYLNKSAASHHLHSFYEEYIDVHGLEDIRPNFQSIISENLREPASASAIKQGYPRGNRGKYSKIPCVKVGNRPMFFKSKLKEWFDMHYAPKLHTTAV